MVEATYLSIGGGIGSFVFADALKIHGVASSEIRVLTLNKNPYEELKKYCDSIGLTGDKKLRSDSGSRPDNFWGFPGYGTETGSLMDKIKLLFEPLDGEYFNPRAKQVYESIDRESKRINYRQMVIAGSAVSIDKLPNGFLVRCKYHNKVFDIKCKHIHLSLGHGNYKRSYKKNYFSAYTLSAESLEKLKAHEGQIFVVGRGTSAQCIVENLLTFDNKYTKVISVFKDKLAAKYDMRGLCQKCLYGWRLQHFNWPRGCFSGALAGNNNMADVWARGSAVPRKSWVDLLRNNYKKGRYGFVYGDVDKFAKKDDLVVLATGFGTDLFSVSLYAKIIKKYKLKMSYTKGFALDKYFRIKRLSSRGSNIFVSGIAADGNSYGPVDSFFGQQFVVVQYIKLLVEQNYISKLGMLSSFNQWLNWINNRQI
jgi:hypothetical protein